MSGPYYRFAGAMMAIDVRAHGVGLDASSYFSQLQDLMTCLRSIMNNAWRGGTAKACLRMIRYGLIPVIVAVPSRSSASNHDASYTHSAIARARPKIYDAIYIAIAAIEPAACISSRESGYGSVRSRKEYQNYPEVAMLPKREQSKLFKAYVKTAATMPPSDIPTTERFRLAPRSPSTCSSIIRLIRPISTPDWAIARYHVSNGCGKARTMALTLHYRDEQWQLYAEPRQLSSGYTLATPCDPLSRPISTNDDEQTLSIKGLVE